MYDINKKWLVKSVTVETLIDILREMPKDAVVSTCGEDDWYIHVDKNSKFIVFDTEEYEEDYDYNEEYSFEVGV